MPGHQSIEDLIGGKTKAAPSNAAQDPTTSGKVSAAFSKKMGEIENKETELETERSASITGAPYIDLIKFPVSQYALKQLPLERAKELQAVCFYATQEEVRIGAIDPQDPDVIALGESIANEIGANQELYTISERSLNRIIELYKTLPDIKPISKDVEIDGEELARIQESVTDFESFQGLFDEASTTDLVTYIMGGALKLGTSDVHIEAEENGIVVRFRLDGILQDAAILPKATFKKLVSRLKLVSGLKINITTKPQDGRFTVKMPDGDVDVRVSTIPTIYGESIVMRLLVQNEQIMTLESLGLRGRAYDQLKTEIDRPNGMIVTTGPTGSGKTTSLYAIMRMLNKPGVKIITLEDPVEYKMEGVNQSQIDHSKDYTFAKGLRSMLRQDPDIAMVGEIRDIETAEIAIQASLTGHLILSTIHTNDAFGAIPRFMSMGVKPFLLAPALNCVIGQRLVRKLCTLCKEASPLEAKLQEKVNTVMAELPEPEKSEVAAMEQVFYAPKGCDKCNEGYKGRLGIYEIFVVNEAIEKAVLDGQVAEYDIRRIAIENGTVTMVQDGIIKALLGDTSIEEVYRVTE